MDKTLFIFAIVVVSAFLVCFFMALWIVIHHEYRRDGTLIASVVRCLSKCGKRGTQGSKCQCGSDNFAMMKCAECNQPATGCMRCFCRLSPCACGQEQFGGPAVQQCVQVPNINTSYDVLMQQHKELGVECVPMASIQDKTFRVQECGNQMQQAIPSKTCQIVENLQRQMAQCAALSQVSVTDIDGEKSYRDPISCNGSIPS